MRLLRNIPFILIASALLYFGAASGVLLIVCACTGWSFPWMLVFGIMIVGALLDLYAITHVQRKYPYLLRWR